MEKHVRTVAWLHIAFSAVLVFLGFAGTIILVGIGMASCDRDTIEVLSILGPIILIFSLLTAVPGIIGGIFLLKYKEWARILMIFISFIDLINFPIGTALGIYSLSILLKQETTKLFIEQPSPTSTG